MEDPGWTSLLPPLTAIVLALTTRRIVPSLLIGIALGAYLIRPGDLWGAAHTLAIEYLGSNLIQTDKLKVFAFTLIMGAMVGLITVAGGMRGLVELVLPWAQTRRRGQALVSLLGLAIFFDDYANMLLIGGTTRPLADRLKISREKLAYLIDSTAAPVAGLALVSTWVAVEIDYIGQGLSELPNEVRWEPIGLFLASFPYRFYPLWAILFVFLIAGSGRDFGPMRVVERKRLDEPPHDQTSNGASLNVPDASSHWLNAALPILTTVGVVVWQLYRSGLSVVKQDDLSPSWANIFGNANSYDALTYGALAGISAAWLMIAPQRIASFKTMLGGMYQGAKAMIPALVILWLSGALATTTGKGPAGLHTGAYLAELTQGSVPLQLLPSVTFLVAAAMAFATGTSWGTMGILMPLAIPVTYDLMIADGVAIETTSLLAGVVGAILAGAIFGDHCSPLSDTTILSSQSCGCDHIAHVHTQMPYALCVGMAAVFCGTLPIALGVSVWACHAAGVLALIGVVFLLGKRPDLK
ncbi:MAG: Na+/H+ antiporter NhaC family protein [Blastopirellula sp. JB062]